ncbi:hypothetical protein F5880DRAFT_1460236, partial [Lentinula raphanica]
LWRILVSETAYLIWKLRCERVIGAKDIEVTQMKRKWQWTFDYRIRTDCMLTSKKFDTKQIPWKIVQSTW